MAESQTIARPYAEAAFGTARDDGSMPAWGEALTRLAAVMQRSEALAMIGDPGLSADRIGGVVADVVGGLTPQQRNFVGLLAHNDRLSVAPQISELYNQLRQAHEGVLAARVTSAFAMSDAQVEQVRATLEQKYGKKVEVTVSVDPELIGGVSIRIGDEVIDASVRGKLAQLAAALTN